ncbi:MAG: hypothetical protein ACLSAP_05725 [Oscillospiraceae bacterium]
MARHIAPKSMVRINLPVPAYEPAPILPVERDETGDSGEKGLRVYGGRFVDGAFKPTRRTQGFSATSWPIPCSAPC